MRKIEIDADQGLFGLVNAIGFEAVDGEIDAWIGMGEFDKSVAERAKALGWIAPSTPYSELDVPLGIL